MPDDSEAYVQPVQQSFEIIKIFIHLVLGKAKVGLGSHALHTDTIEYAPKCMHYSSSIV